MHREQLGLGEKQYVIHQMIMGIPYAYWPVDLKKYIQSRFPKGGLTLNGTTLAMELAIWIRLAGEEPR